VRILIVAPTFPPASDGLANTAFVHATGFVARGHEVVVATGRLDGMSAEEVISGVRVVRFRVGGRPHITGVHGEVREFRAFVRSFRCDVVFCHSWQVWSTELALPELRHVDARKVLVSHGFSANSHVGAKGWAYWVAYRPYVWTTWPSLLRSLDHLVVLADAYASRSYDRNRFHDHLVARTLGHPPVSIIPNGADLAAHESADTTFADRHALAGKRIVLSVGKYHWLKNDRGVVRAFCDARPENAALVMIGPSENAYLSELRRMAARAPLPSSSRILFLVGCAREEIFSAYRAASLFVTASLTECFPLVILDAMASRTAWLSTDVGCVSTLPGGVTVGSERGLTAAISRLLGDEALRARLAEEGRRVCEQRFTWSRVVAEYEALVERLAREAAPRDHLASNA
jgi:glycosyltransferase involved in cell wall biosynthesis